MWCLTVSRGRGFCILYRYFFDKRKYGLKKKRTNTLDDLELNCNRDIIFCYVFTEKPSIRPSITTHPQGDVVREGNNVTLSCNVSGNPEPSISWTIDGFQVNTTINSQISFSADEKQLTITNAKRTDNGNYRCVAENSLGIATSDAATVDVQCKFKSLVNGVSMTQGCHVVKEIGRAHV